MKLAELIIQMSANTASLDKDFKRGLGMAENFASGIKSALGTLGVGASITGLADLVKTTVDYEHQVGLAAKATGMTVQQVSSLGFAARTVAVPLESINMGLAYFDRVISGLMRSKAGATAFADLGLSAREANGQLKGNHELLMEVADAFGKLKDSTEKNAIAGAMFGQTYGRELIPLLDKGRAGIEDLEAKARALGVTLTDTDIEAADQAYTSFNNLTSALRGLEVEAVNKTVPALLVVSETLLGNQNAIGAFADWLKLMGAGLADTFVQPLALSYAWAEKLHDRLGTWATDTYTDENVYLKKLKSDLADIGKLGDDNIKINLPGNPGAGADKITRIKKENYGPTKDMVGLDVIENAAAASERFWMLYQQGLERAKTEFPKLLSYEQEFTKSLDEQAKSLARLNQDFYNAMRSGDFAAAGLKPGILKLGDTVPTLNKLDQLKLSVKDFFTSIKTDVDQFGNKVFDTLSRGIDGISRQFADLVVTGRTSFRQLFQGIEEEILQAGFQNMIGQLMGAASNAAGASHAGTGGGGITGLLGKFFGGFMAGGGDVTPGKAYVVGEHHPEFFVPNTPGQIRPALGMSASSRQVINQFHFHAVRDFDSFKASQGQMMSWAIAQAALAHQRNR